jgi:hypothetical protein
MKKVITVILFLISTAIFSQSETYIKTYTGFFTEIADIKKDYEEMRTVVIFHPGGRNEVIVNVNDAVVRYFPITPPEKGTDNKGNTFQLVECIKENTGKIVQLHIYPDKLRIYIQNDYIEFLNL